MSDTDIVVEIETQLGKETVNVDANVAYTKIHRFIQGFMGQSVDPNTEQGRLSALVRVGVKGVLLMYGDKILDSMFNSKEHPRPGKKDDIVNWYTDMFTKVALAQMVKSTTTFVGVKDGDSTRVTEVHTRSNTQ